MKLPLVLFALLALPIVVTAQKYGAFDEALSLEDDNLLLIAVPGEATYKITFGTLLTNLQSRLSGMNGNIAFVSSNTYNIGSPSKPARNLYANYARIFGIFEVRTGEMEGVWIGDQSLVLGTNLSGVAHGMSIRRSSDGAIVNGIFDYDDGETPSLGIQSIADISFINYPGDRHMTIKQDGKVGIGTITPTTSLDVTGGVRAATMTIVGTTNQLIFGATNSAPAGAATPTKWVSVQVTGDAGVYKIPLYQ